MINLLVTTYFIYTSAVTGYDCDTDSWPPTDLALQWQAYCRLSGFSAFAINENCTYADYRNASSTHLAEYEAGIACDLQSPTRGCFIYDSDGTRCPNDGTLRAVNSGSNAAESRSTELWAGLLSAAFVILVALYVITCHGHKIEDTEIFHDDILEIQDDLKPKTKAAEVELANLDSKNSGGDTLDSIDGMKKKPNLPPPIRVYIADDEENLASKVRTPKEAYTPRELSPLPRERVPSPPGLMLVIPEVQESPRNFNHPEVQESSRNFNQPEVQESPRNFNQPEFLLKRFNTLEISPRNSYRVFVNPSSGSSFNLIPVQQDDEYESSRSSFQDLSSYPKRSMSPRAESEFTLVQAWSLSNAERNRRAHATNGNSVARSRKTRHKDSHRANRDVARSSKTRRKNNHKSKREDKSNWNNTLHNLMTTKFDDLAIDIEVRLKAEREETTEQLKKMEADFRKRFGEESLPQSKNQSITPPPSKSTYIISPSSFEYPPTTPYALSPHTPVLSPRSASYVHPDYVPATSTPSDRHLGKRGPLTVFDKDHPLTFDSSTYFQPESPLHDARSRLLDIKIPSGFDDSSDEPGSYSSSISESKENLTKQEKHVLEMFFDIFANEMGVLDLSGVQSWVKAVHLSWDDDAYREDAMERIMLNGENNVITRKGYLNYYREMKPARPHKFQKEMTNLKSWNITEEPEREMDENLSLLERDLLERFFDFFAQDNGVLEFPEIVQWVKAVYLDWDEDSYLADAEARLMMSTANDQVSKQGYLNFYRDMKQTGTHKFYEELDNLKQWDLPMEPIPRGSSVLVDFDAQGWHRGEVSKRIGDFYTLSIDGASFVVQRERIQLDPERSTEPRIKPKNMPDGLWKLRDQLGI